VTRIRITVDDSELDALGHVNQSFYHKYAERGRQASVEAAGGTFDDLLTAHIAPVLLESHIVFRRELRAGDTVEVISETKFGSGKTFHMTQLITKLDGTLSAELTSTLGMMDLRARRLLPDPRAVFASLGVNLDLLTAPDDGRLGGVGDRGSTTP
jgi:acyl-CoA thioester hydrolase